MLQPITIIGAGIGGLCTGIRLLYAGYPVAIYEKNAHPGGVLCYTSDHNSDYIFNESASIAINPLTYFEIFKDTKRPPKNYFQWIPLNTCYKVFWPSSKVLPISTNLAQTQTYLKNLFPDDVTGYTRFIFDTSLNYLNSKTHLLSRTFTTVSDFLDLRTLYHLLEIAPFTNASQYISSYIHAPELRELLLFQTLFMGISPYKLPNIYAAIPAQTQIEGLIHIKGGLAAYTLALTRLFEELGGKIYYHHPVQRLITHSNTVLGMLCNGRFISAHKVILNTDLPYSKQTLLSAKHLASFVQSCSTFVIHLGLNRKFDTLRVHNLYINKFFKKEVERIFNGKLPLTPSLYLYYPSAVDDSYCTNSTHSVLNIMIRVPNLQTASVDWTNPRLTAKLYQICLKILATLPGLHYIHQHVVSCSFTTPHTFATKYNYTAGSCFGIGHTFLQSMAFRPQLKDPTYSNLYYVGTSIHPGNGASIVMDGAKLLAKTIIEQDGKSPLRHNIT